MGRALVLGGYGAIGSAVAERLASDGLAVRRGTREARADRPDAVVVDLGDAGDEGLAALDGLEALDVVVWAQGVNVNDDVASVQPAAFRAVLEANLTFVALSLARLERSGRLAEGARLCVVSSIWQQVARRGKFSYAVSKGALGGLVAAAATDLAARRILVNAVLPGVVDTAMTRGVLSAEQVARVEGATGFGRLTTLEDVAELVAWLCSPANTGVTGQSIAVDLGFSAAREL